MKGAGQRDEAKGQRGRHMAANALAKTTIDRLRPVDLRLDISSLGTLSLSLSLCLSCSSLSFSLSLSLLSRTLYSLAFAKIPAFFCVEIGDPVRNALIRLSRDSFE